jgi:hypothetical protein
MKKLIQVLANKDWEVDPLIAVLKSPASWPDAFKSAKFAEKPPSFTLRDQRGEPRWTYTARVLIDLMNADIEVWCIRDLMEAPPAHRSSSQEKARVLDLLKKHHGKKPSLVVAFGTAAFPDDVSRNGGVAIGSAAFVHNPYANNPNCQSDWRHDQLGQLLPDSIPGGIMQKLANELRQEIEERFLVPPLCPAKPAELMLAAGQVAVSSVNVTDDSEYGRVDPEAINALREKGFQQPIGSVETTHGLIRLMIPSDHFLYVSGIPNRLGKFETEVKPRLYAQNFVAAHNAGIALTRMLPTLAA